MAQEPFSFDDHIQRQVGPDDWAKRKALNLFYEIRDVLGDEGARSIFAMWGAPPSPSKLRWIQNSSVLTRLEMMPGGPNVKKLAREIAQEKYVNPTPEEVENEVRQIRRLKAKRKPKPRKG